MTDLRIINADVLAGLAELEDGSVQCVVTSPPYWGLRDYGVEGQIGLEPTVKEYVAKMVEVFGEVRRVLRDDGVLWLNLGDSYHSGDRGGYRNDTHRWDNSHMQAMGRGSHMEQVSPNRLPQEGLKDKDLCGMPWRVAFALQVDGWYLRSDIIWAKPNPMPESVTDRPTKAHEYVFLMTKSKRYFYDADAIREITGNELSANEYAERTAPGATWPSGGLTKYAGAHKHDGGRAHPNGRNARSVWTIATQPYADAHFATFPTALPERCIKAGSRQGDTVLDPFAGSGTALLVARGLGRNAIAIEISPEYVRLMEERCALPWEREAPPSEDSPQQTLFGPVDPEP